MHCVVLVAMCAMHACLQLFVDVMWTTSNTRRQHVDPDQNHQAPTPLKNGTLAVPLHSAANGVVLTYKLCVEFLYSSARASLSCGTVAVQSRPVSLTDKQRTWTPSSHAKLLYTALLNIDWRQSDSVAYSAAAGFKRDSPTDEHAVPGHGARAAAPLCARKGIKNAAAAF